ncbi:hypothetical protein DDB_G0273215 [Dictyostelium discoideum AX4]|uniref:Uncharacterized protein n=1 Tax=Dictyostelium discoideum TaxID=44689 RepID=Q556Z8_DICDI|nr:hypothetical protein DDB_G0273709 [Dictyostelium discoideum AX4]XP_644779.1 hypothetical protein DDB_G0273215 [Dictyostelium discoideum AX4]EAL70545.1 hypothetical protein DDB_G0273709 [Dictyostelium discoideum AX4]EAL70825.1 hypothetical protein DDB_G0273215 [Dictyostelium discoideum AX4]|eukprot:XP_644471.1 hypothetical protein DDB_G0273709 [Dictyostelium discoideum AX4]
MYKFNYENDIDFANNQPIEFWDEVAKDLVHWDKMYEKVYSDDEIYPDWFKGGELNTCYNVLDIHIKNPETRDQDALIYECPYLKKTVKLTYYQLYEKVCEFSRVLLNLNISKNDNVLIYMSNTLEPLIAMLSCARIGATHCVLFDGYSVKSLIDRIETITPKLIITTNYGIFNDEIINFIPNLKESIELSTFKPSNVITLFRNDITSESDLKKVNDIPTIPNTLSWYDEIKKFKENNQLPFYEYVPVESSHPLYILYTSGTTGNSKGAVRSNGPHLVGIKYQTLIQKGKTKVVFYHTSVGWISIHNAFNGLLSLGYTLVMFEGGLTKTKHMEDDIWEVIERNKVTCASIMAKAIRYLIKVDPECKNLHSKYDLSNLKEIIVGGEPIEESIPNYIQEKLKVKSIRVYGQTETGACYFYCYDYKNLKIPINTSGFPFSSLKAMIFSDDGKELGVNEIGELVFKLPLPPSFATTFYKNDEKFKQLFTKFPGYYNPGDLGFKDENNCYGVVSRSDDQIKISGNKVQLNKIETSILKHPLVLECCSIGIYNPDCYNVPIAFLVLKQQEDQSIQQIDLNKLQSEINIIISKDIENFAILRKTLIVTQIPKTKAGKIQRQIISKYLNDINYELPDNVCDVEIFYKIKDLYNNVK